METKHVDPFAILSVADESTTEEDTQSTDEGYLTAEQLVRKCKEHQGFRTPELNEKLYLHHSHLTRLCPLQEYTNVRVVYLSNNRLQSLEPLTPLVQLKSLYVAQNGLESLSTFPHLPQLTLLDVSFNSIASLPPLPEKFPSLEILNLSHNAVGTLEGGGLEALEHLQVLDVSYNRLELADGVFDTVDQLPSLRSLMLHGNRVVKETPQYRKKRIASSKGLRFLDEYPIFEEERHIAEAFMAEGSEGEQKAREDLQRQKDEDRAKRFAYYSEQRQKRADSGTSSKKEPSAYLLDQDTDDIYIPV